ncbi:heterokaryon incompatibility protein [Colletotrichum cuscutae]|uniref:Heterokaryon incompatibility protein n=1 Tax=Colletotrichum cuscutae TaxID=1209917 RepID=A0AAI9TVT2_9PEZI|nr:heterokaryon incompatibility protein [Colletotrichum cuscutae]
MNGQVVLVGQSLEAALRALSSDPDYIDGLKIWADAICINQRDLAERNRQVKRMRQIYGRALIVSIWLGDVPNDSISDMAQLHELIVKSQDKAAASEVLEVAMTDPEKKETIRRAIYVVVKKTYWSRIWVIQEKCLGPFNPSILFGTFRMGLVPFHNFLQGVTNIHGAVRAREKVWRILKLVELVNATQERVRRGRAQTNEERRQDQDDLGLLLMIGRMAGSLDLRDRLYGLMGMIPEYVAKLIEPDYTKKVEDVFSDFASALITGFESFDIVLTGTTESTLKLPSWVPDLTSPWDPYLWGTDCNASWGQKAKFRVENDGKAWLLSWAGNTVVSVSGKMPNDPKAAIVRTLHRAATYNCDSETTILDIPWLESLSPDDPDILALEKRGWGKVLKHANLNDLTQFRKQVNDNFQPWGRRFESFFPRVQDVRDGVDPKPFLESLDKHIGIVYPVFTTVKGLFGTAILQQIRKGDSIFIIPGCSAPIVMRQNNGQWQVISQCFVDGLMCGEMKTAVGVNGCELTEIRIS